MYKVGDRVHGLKADKYGTVVEVERRVRYGELHHWIKWDKSPHLTWIGAKTVDNYPIVEGTKPPEISEVVVYNGVIGER